MLLPARVNQMHCKPLFILAPDPMNPYPDHKKHIRDLACLGKEAEMRGENEELNTINVFFLL